MAKYQWKTRHQKDGLRINGIFLFRTGGQKLEEVAELTELEASMTAYNTVSGSFKLHNNKIPWRTSENFMIGIHLEYRRSGKKIFHTHHHIRVEEVDGIKFKFRGRKGFTKYGEV